VLFAFFVAEVGLRVVGFSYVLYPETIEFGMPDPATLASDFEPDRELFWVPQGYETNTLTVLQHAKPALVLMGCSCTEWGDHDRLMGELVGQHHPGCKLSAINAGVAGWTTYQGLAQLRRDIIPASPRVVTIYYGWNDHWVGFGIEDKQVHWVNESRLFQLQRHSRVAQLVTKAAVTWWHGQRSGPILRVQPEDFRNNLRAMVRECKAQGIVPVLLTAPTSHERGREPEHLARRHLANLDDLVPLHQRYVDIVREVADDEDVILCDLAEVFDGYSRDEVRTKHFQVDGIHLRPAGNRVIAEALYRTFEEHDLLELILK
jgi:lysophospholipase L1-like esterase